MKVSVFAPVCFLCFFIGPFSSVCFDIYLIFFILFLMSICFVMGGIWIWVAGELGKSGGVIEEETVIRKYCMKKIYFQVEKIEKKFPLPRYV